MAPPLFATNQQQQSSDNRNPSVTGGSLSADLQQFGGKFQPDDMHQNLTIDEDFGGLLNYAESVQKFLGKPQHEGVHQNVTVDQDCDYLVDFSHSVPNWTNVDGMWFQKLLEMSPQAPFSDGRHRSHSNPLCGLVQELNSVRSPDSGMCSPGLDQMVPVHSRADCQEDSATDNVCSFLNPGSSHHSGSCSPGVAGYMLPVHPQQQQQQQQESKAVCVNYILPMSDTDTSGFPDTDKSSLFGTETVISGLSDADKSGLCAAYMPRLSGSHVSGVNCLHISSYNHYYSSVCATACYNTQRNATTTSADYSNTKTATPDYSNIKAATPDYSNIKTASPDYSNIKADTPDYSNIKAATPDYSNIKAATPGMSGANNLHVYSRAYFNTPVTDYTCNTGIATSPDCYRTARTDSPIPNIAQTTVADMRDYQLANSPSMRDYQLANSPSMTDYQLANSSFCRQETFSYPSIKDQSWRYTDSSVLLSPVTMDTDDAHDQMFVPFSEAENPAACIRSNYIPSQNAGPNTQCQNAGPNTQCQNAGPNTQCQNARRNNGRQSHHLLYSPASPAAAPTERRRVSSPNYIPCQNARSNHAGQMQHFLHSKPTTATPTPTRGVSSKPVGHDGPLATSNRHGGEAVSNPAGQATASFTTPKPGGEASSNPASQAAAFGTHEYVKYVPHTTSGGASSRLPKQATAVTAHKPKDGEGFNPDRKAAAGQDGWNPEWKAAAEEMARDATKGADGKFDCPYKATGQCPDKYQAGFRTKALLTIHLRWHIHEFPFMCRADPGTCCQLFQRQDSRKRHENTHRRQDPTVQCNVCDIEGCKKTFARKDHLHKHRKTHENPRRRASRHAPY